MAVNLEGKMEGSIGGGIMEHKWVALAKEQLIDGVDTLHVRKQIHDKTAVTNQSGMICSGEQTILLYRLKGEDGKAVDEIVSSMSASENGLLRLSPDGLFFQPQPPDSDYYFSFTNEDKWIYEEKTGYKNRIFIIGAGHCALALCRLMSWMDFHISLFDDRAALNTFLQNNFAHQKRMVDDYTELESLIPSGGHHYVICMTFGYRTDDVVIRTLLHKEFKYFGVLGSSSKMGKMFDGYVAEGMAEEKIRKLHAPVGLPIRSQTPEEIAISIVAEIIKIKNEDV